MSRYNIHWKMGCVMGLMLGSKPLDKEQRETVSQYAQLASDIISELTQNIMDLTKKLKDLEAKDD